MPYTTDWIETKITNPEFKCKKCKSNEIEYREWESSDGAHDDLEYKCNGCGKHWWVEGSDC